MRSAMAQPCCGPERDGLQDEEVERALREIHGGGRVFPFRFYNNSTPPLVEVQGEYRPWA